jgi:hypothetical protein
VRPRRTGVLGGARTARWTLFAAGWGRHQAQRHRVGGLRRIAASSDQCRNQYRPSVLPPMTDVFGAARLVSGADLNREGGAPAWRIHS